MGYAIIETGAKAEKWCFAFKGVCLKRQKLLKEIIKQGAVFVRPGAHHDIYEPPRTNISTQVPRFPALKPLLTFIAEV